MVPDLSNLPTIITLIWIGIAVCASRAAMLSGLDLALFSISQLRLEVEVGTDNKAAAPEREEPMDGDGFGVGWYVP